MRHIQDSTQVWLTPQSMLLITILYCLFNQGQVQYVPLRYKMAEPLGVTCYSASSWRCHQTVSGLPIPGAKRNEGDVEGSMCTG